MSRPDFLAKHCDPARSSWSMRSVFTILTCLGLLGPLRAMALPPPGTDLNSPEHKWWECWTQPVSHKSCCSEADGHSLGDADWRPKPDALGAG